jgi:hypothetical protein
MHHAEPFDARGVARLASGLRIKRWQLRAEECRAVAETMRDPARKPLLAMAEHCERMAERAAPGSTRDRHAKIRKSAKPDLREWFGK